MAGKFPRVENGEHVFTSGKTGSGKTKLMQYMTLPLERLLVIDIKHGLGEWGLEDFENGSLRKIKNNTKYRIRVLERLDAIEAMEVAYETGNTTIYIDEVVAFIPEHTKAPEIVTNIWQRGRQFNVRGWASTQRPKLIPLTFLSEASHVFTFRLNLEADRKRVFEIVGKKAVLKPIPSEDKYGFYYYNVNDDSLRYYHRLNI